MIGRAADPRRLYATCGTLVEDGAIYLGFMKHCLEHDPLYGQYDSITLPIQH